MNNNLEILDSFLLNRGWVGTRRTDKFWIYSPPQEIFLPENFKLKVPFNDGAPGFSESLRNTLTTISEIHEIKIEDLSNIISKKSEIFSFRISDQDTKYGTISFERFEKLLEKLKGILVSTASFVISEDPLNTKKLGEAELYLRSCNFLQTEKGSFISKIDLPTNLKIVEEGMYGQSAISSEQINHRIKRVFEFINSEIFTNEEIDMNTRYLGNNREIINIKLFTQIEQFYAKVKIQNLDIKFESVQFSDQLSVTNLNTFKLKRLKAFIKSAKEILSTTIPKRIIGKVISLRSNNPDGLTNQITINGFDENGELVKAIAHLDSETYKRASEFHIESNEICISGEARLKGEFFKYETVDIFEIQNS